MGGIYGNFSKRIESKFVNRYNALECLSESFVEHIGRVYPKLKPFVHVNYANVRTVTGRYCNDLARYHALHDIDVFLHRSKVTSHTLKWMSLYPPLSVSIDKDTFSKLEKSEEKAIYNMNSLLHTTVIQYFLNSVTLIASPEDDKKAKKFVSEVIYTLKTGSYETHMANLAFESIS